jgi:hypothetical protein
MLLFGLLYLVLSMYVSTMVFCDYLYAFCFALFSLTSCHTAATNLGNYPRIPIEIERIVEDASLVDTFKLDLLASPWSTAPPQATRVWLWNDDDSLYFHFECRDTNVVVRQVEGELQSIGTSDRAELFFAADTLLTTYYGMEIDPSGRILSFKARSYRQCDYLWSWPNTALKVQTIIQPLGYKVQGSLALSYLDSLGLIQNGHLLVGIFRADYQSLSDPWQVDWLTWRIPASKTPDFHIPTAFGTIQLN